MSRVYFTSPSGEAELLGSERAWLGRLCSDIAVGVLAPRSNWQQLSRFTADKLPAGHGFTEANHWVQGFTSRMNVGWDEGYLSYEGKTISEFELVLNTALAVGSHPVKLAARIHGQCEIHGYIEEEDRAWLDGIIEDGLWSGVFRRELRPQNADGTYGEPRPLGWEKVLELLRAGDDEPVVMSYSVCDGFPNPNETAWLPPEPTEGDIVTDNLWYALPDEDKWRHGMQWLRDTESRMLRINPDDFDTMRFGHCLTAFDLLAPDAEERVEEALGA
jgi:hypothetical protein